MRDHWPLRTASRGGVRLRYQEGGTGAPPLVFVHGWGCDHRFFAPQVRHFAARHRVVAPDQRGFGASDKPRQEYTIEGFADDLAWLCAELDLERPVIVGHSLGGAVALAAAARHPKLPGAIALCDPAILFPESAEEVRRDLVEALASPGWIEALREFIELYMFIESDDPVRRAWVVREMCANAQHVMHSAFERLASFDSDAAARACAVPLLHIDAAVPIADTDRLRRLCPQLETGRTPDAGHFHQLEAAAAINLMLERFVDAHAPS